MFVDLDGTTVAQRQCKAGWALMHGETKLVHMLCTLVPDMLVFCFQYLKRSIYTFEESNKSGSLQGVHIISLIAPKQYEKPTD